jgi:hypothetical protein
VRTSSVTAGAVAFGIALVAVVTSAVGVAPASAAAGAAATGCRGDRITVDALASGCAVSTGTVVLPDGRRFAVPAAGTTVSALPVAATGAHDAGDVSITNTGATGVAVLLDERWSGSAAAVRKVVRSAGGVGTGDHAPHGTADPHGSALERLRAAAGGPTASAPQAATSAAAAKPSSCTNKTYSKLGVRWSAPVQWRYNPAGQPVAGAAAIRAGADAWTGAIASCGKKVTTTAGERLLGTTTQAVGVTTSGGCGTASGASVVGFGALPAGTLAVTCVWSRSGVAVEADQRYTTRQQWSVATTCSGARFDLRGVATHEWGHAFGLGHTAQTSGLVMKPASTTCETGQRTLGLGDVLGIDAVY